MGRKNPKPYKGHKSQVKRTAVTTHSDEGVNHKDTESMKKSVKEETPEERIVRKAYELAPEWKIGHASKRRFMSLPAPLQTSAGKEICIKETLAAHKDWIPDPTRYWIWLQDETEKLTRVWDFKETCEKAGLNPQTVAQHLILEGKAVCNAIRLEGLEAYGSNIRMFTDPLFEDDLNFYGNKKQEVAHE